MPNLQESLDAFLEGGDKVFVLKGGWGVGKTYAWNDYINKKISNTKKSDKKLKQIAYSYISFFGKTSLSDVRKSIFHSAKSIISDDKIKEVFQGKFADSNRLLGLVPWVNWLTKNIQKIPSVEKFSNIISSVEYSLVDNYIICFDDIERKGDTLAIKEIMGLIDELAIHKDCKVILIFNENELSTDIDKTEFDLYREKVVDIELNYDPTCGKNMEIACPNGFNRLSIIKNVVNELNINNIRVLRKIHRTIEEFHFFENNLSDLFIRELITHAIFLCWGYCTHIEGLSFKDIKFHLRKNSLKSFICDKDKEKEKTPDEKRHIRIVHRLRLNSSHFDTHIINYLERGFVDQKKLNVDQFNKEIQNIEDAYDSFTRAHDPKLMDDLEIVLNKYMDKVKLSAFSNAIRILEQGRKERVSFYIEEYIKANKESLKNTSARDIHGIKNEELKIRMRHLKIEFRRVKKGS